MKEHITQGGTNPVNLVS